MELITGEELANALASQNFFGEVKNVNFDGFAAALNLLASRISDLSLNTNAENVYTFCTKVANEMQKLTIAKDHIEITIQQEVAAIELSSNLISIGSNDNLAELKVRDRFPNTKPFLISLFALLFIAVALYNQDINGICANIAFALAGTLFGERDKLIKANN